MLNKSFLTALLTGLFLSLVAGVNAQAKTPVEILKPYKKYQAALQADNFEVARAAAEQAWQISEKLLGDVKLTGDLAFNYGSIIKGEIKKNQVKAVARSMELVEGYGPDSSLIYLERGIMHLTVLGHLDQSGRQMRAGEKLISFAEANGLETSTFTAEALTMVAGLYANRGRNEKASAYAERAMAVFEAAGDGVVSVYPLQANLYRGYAYEGEDDHMAAALSYQAVMEATDGLDPEVYPLVGTTLGRWIYMRSALRAQGKLEEAEMQGVCKCWPYDKERNEDVLPIKRVPPVMPSFAQQSGYVVVEFDLTDDGKPTNKRVIAAWPDYFEKPALQSVKRWEYSPRTSEQTDEDRTDIVTTITFRLADSKGNVIW